MATHVFHRNRKPAGVVAATTLLAAALTMPASIAAAAPASGPGASLAACQAAVAKQSTKYRRSVSRMVGKCLGAMTRETFENGATPSGAAVAASGTCAKAFRKLLHSEKPVGQVSSKFAARLDKACDPSVNPDLAHLESDTWGVGASRLAAANLGDWCRSGGGDGSVDSYAEWRDCVGRAAECEARQLIANQWPRALQFLEALAPVIAGLPASTARDDSLAALSDLDKALEGSQDDNQPDLACGIWNSALPATGQDLCDQGDGTLGSCTSAANDDDGKLAAGLPRRFVDNGDGTISDLVTGLMWEKLGDDGSINDVDRCYDMSMLDLKPDFRLNWNRFAGHADWRVPTRDELESLVDAGRHAPAIDPIFHTDCTPGCSPLECSCTNSGRFLSSTPYGLDPDYMENWAVNFHDGSVQPMPSNTIAHIRGVRGGPTDRIAIGNEPPVALDRSVRNPWRSPCVPVQMMVWDPDSRDVEISFQRLPEHGFLTRFVSGGCEHDFADAMAPTDEFSQLFGYTAFENAVFTDHFGDTWCYIPFSPTFTGFDSFTYIAQDTERHMSLVPGVVSIEIFED